MTTTTKPTRRGSSLAALVRPLDEEPAQAPAQVELPVQAEASPKLSQFNVFVTAGDHKRLKHLSTDTGLSLQKLAHEGLNLMLQARGLPPLAPATAGRPSGRRGGEG